MIELCDIFVDGDPLQRPRGKENQDANIVSQDTAITFTVNLDWENVYEYCSWKQVDLRFLASGSV